MGVSSTVRREVGCSCLPALCLECAGERGIRSELTQSRTAVSFVNFELFGTCDEIILSIPRRMKDEERLEIPIPNMSSIVR